LYPHIPQPLTILGYSLFGANSWDCSTSVMLRTLLLTDEKNQQVVVNGLRKISLWYLTNIIEMQSKMPQVIQDKDIVLMEKLLQIDKGNYFLNQ
jgi:hypothetical protein